MRLKNIIKHDIKWMGFYPQSYGVVHNNNKTITCKIQSQLGNEMFSSSHLSTGGSLNQLIRVVVIPEQVNKM